MIRCSRYGDVGSIEMEKKQSVFFDNWFSDCLTPDPYIYRWRTGKVRFYIYAYSGARIMPLARSTCPVRPYYTVVLRREIRNFTTNSVSTFWVKRKSSSAVVKIGSERTGISYCFYTKAKMD